MIYTLTGNDTKNKNIYLKKICKNVLPIILSKTDFSKEVIFNYANSASLFGDLQIIVADGLIREEEMDFSSEELDILNNSKTVFVFLEDKLLVADLKKYKKYGVIEEFNKVPSKVSVKTNIFNIADAYAKRDKIGTWILYREAVSLGTAPEEISGIIFWKIKTMLLSGTKTFSSIELKERSSNLVSLYHNAHRGNCDFVIGLEQFILSSLNK